MSVLLPDQALSDGLAEALQVVAFVENHERAELSPTVIEDGTAARLTVGIGTGTGGGRGSGGGGGVGLPLTNSYVPISHADPWGRALPSKSRAIFRP